MSLGHYCIVNMALPLHAFFEEPKVDTSYLKSGHKKPNLSHFLAIGKNKIENLIFNGINREI